MEAALDSVQEAVREAEKNPAEKTGQEFSAKEQSPFPSACERDSLDLSSLNLYCTHQAIFLFTSSLLRGDHSFHICSNDIIQHKTLRTLLYIPHNKGEIKT
ncbi:unnamed protein product [Sphagnum troendelagicum]|uniref:Uncharacterized protein n=1 Tax=Sphagnum troendelagicum TaxID=128251 RepID=A0ABP0TB41_9BRYO